MAEDDIPFAETVLKHLDDTGEHPEADDIEAGSTLQSITAMERFEEWSFEELRVTDYAAGARRKSWRVLGASHVFHFQ